MYQIFISYPVQDETIIENLRERLDSSGIKAWMYSHDKTISEDIWEEINEKISSCKMILFVVSKHTKKSKGQKQELNHAINLITSSHPHISILPIIIGDISFSDVPEQINHINGIHLDIYNIKTVTIQISKTVNPDLSPKEWEWKYPLPCQWLEVSNLDQWTEEYFDLGDKVYFRRLSPMGLFECYSPKLEGLFWFYSKNLCPSSIVDEDGTYEKEHVPEKYRVSTLLEIERKYYNKITA